MSHGALHGGCVKNRIVAIFVGCVLVACPAWADVLLDLRTTNMPATTQPAGGESLVGVLAVPGHEFEAKFEASGRTVEVRGSVEQKENGRYRVEIKFTDRQDGIQSVDTAVILTTGQAIELGGLHNGTMTRTTILTLKPTGR